MAEQSLLFIPDISGFTKFVTETEITHSQHIISELISVIINENTLGLQISEIEGDAVLFYRIGKPPSFKELTEQTKKMFISFHSYLNSIEQNNVCQCGVCTTASNLTLKFITHYGELEEVAIDKFNKLIGSDVILVHRLLKNNIPTNEYILLTEKYLDSLTEVDTEKEEWVKLEKNIEEIKNFGQIKSKYISLSKLKSTIPPPTKSEVLKLKGKVGNLSIDINKPLLKVHSVISDVESKKCWVEGLKKLRLRNKINRINNVHTCEFTNLKMDITTLSNQVCENEITYSEELVIFNNIKIIIEFVLNEIDEGTNVLLRFYSKNIESKNIFYRIKFKILLKMIIKMMNKNLERLKNYCENL